eukprot:s1362_g16.t1
MKEAKIVLAGLQETRLKTPLRLHDDDFFLVTGPANARGHFGTMLCISKKTPYGYTTIDSAGHPLYFAESDYSVIEAGPRLLVVRIATTALKLIVIVAHAPHTGTDLAEIEAFWHTVALAIPAKYSEWAKILLADVNARFGDSPSAHIGSWQAEIATDKSEPFVSFVCQHDLFLPASFQEYHHGVAGTWRHPNGEWKRNDVVAASRHLSLHKCCSWISEDIDVSLSKDDHRPALLQVHWHSQPSCAYTPTKSHKAGSSIGFDQRMQLHAVADIRPCTDVHTHLVQLQQYIANCTQHDPQQTIHHRMPKKQTLSQSTWELVCHKRAWRTNLAECQKLQNKTYLAALFSAWRTAPHAQMPTSACSDFDDILLQLDKDVAIALHQFRTLGRQVSDAVRKDDAHFFSQLSQDCSLWLGPAHTKKFWQTLRRHLPKFRSRRFGHHPAALERLEDQWAPFFERLEVGYQYDAETLVRDCHQRQIQAPVVQFDYRLDELPSIIAFEDVLRQTQPHKATGFDPLPSDVFRQYACEMASQFFPLAFKMLVWQHEPVANKGGEMAVIHKKGSIYNAENYRGIMLLNTFSKRFHAMLRTHVMGLLARQRPAGQMGGFAHQQVNFGCQAIQTFGRLMDQHHLSSAVLYVDLTTAFHRLIREFVSGTYVPDDLNQILEALLDEGLSVAELQARLQLPNLLEKLHAPLFLQQLMRDIHTGTWLTAGRARTFVVTRRGTRPGSPLADCIFHLLMATILDHLNQWIAQQGQYMQILREVGISLDTVAWADDLAIPWATRTAQELPAALQMVLTQVHDTFRSSGFLLNMQQGKTSAVVSFRGSGAVAMRQKYQLIAQPGDVVILSGNECFLHYSSHYKHLGTIFSADHGFEVELRTRMGIAHSTFSQLAKPILCNRHLPETVRLRLFQTLVGFRIEFDSEALPEVIDVKHVRGLHRVEALQAEGPLPLQQDCRLSAIACTTAHITSLEAELQIDCFPSEAEELERSLFTRLNELTFEWFVQYRDSGFDQALVTDLPDVWLSILFDFEPAFDDWAEAILLAWGEHCLPDVCTTLEDGDTAGLIDATFADLCEDLPRGHLMRQLTFQRAKLQRMQQDQNEPFTHRPIRWGTANSKERQLTAQNIPSLFAQQAEWLSQISAIEWDALPAHHEVPATVDSEGRPSFLIVHLFSGRRRAGDIHERLDFWARQYGFQVQVLSLDTAVSGYYGNLVVEHITWQHLTELYQANRVAATICGSPCETFSAARHHQPDPADGESTRHWPRPLRSAVRFLGLDHLTGRELNQLQQGSEFFFQGLLALAWTLCHGGLYMSEHPWIPSDPDLPSIWTSAWIKLMRKHPAIDLHRVCQWRWGAPVRKPTGILALRLPRFSQSMYSRQLPNVQEPTDVAIGKDASGQFKTSALKEYPEAFSNALAATLADQLREVVRRRTWKVADEISLDTSQWLREATHASSIIRASAVWLPDYQG